MNDSSMTETTIQILYILNPKNNTMLQRPCTKFPLTFTLKSETKHNVHNSHTINKTTSCTISN